MGDTSDWFVEDERAGHRDFNLQDETLSENGVLAFMECSDDKESILKRSPVHETFYELPISASTSSSSKPFQFKRDSLRDPEDISLLRRLVPPLQPIFEKTLSEPTHTLIKDVIAGLDTLRSMEFLGWIAHLICLNQLADNELIQGFILSLYASGPLYTDPYRIYTFFRQNFTILPLAYEDVWSVRWSQHIHSTTSHSWKLWHQLMLKRLIRALRRREGPAPMIHLLFIALCRCLKIHSRLVLALPSSTIQKSIKAEQLMTVFNGPVIPSQLTQGQFLDSMRCVFVGVPPQPILRNWFSLLGFKQNNYYKSYKKRRREFDMKENKSSSCYQVSVGIWAEVFSKAKGRWVALSLENKQFDWTHGVNSRERTEEIQLCSDQPLGQEVAAVTTLAMGESSCHEGFLQKKDSSLNQCLFLSSDSSSNDGISTVFSRDVKGEREMALNESFQEKIDSSIAHVLDIERYPLSPMTEEDMTLHQMSYTFSFGQRIKQEKDEEHVKASLFGLNSLKRPALLSQPIKTCSSGEERNNHSNLVILACNAYNILRDVTLRYRYQEWSNVLEKRGIRGSTRIQNVVDDWNIWVESKHSKAKEMEDYMMAKGVDSLDTYALQEKAIHEMLPKSKISFRHHHRFVLESQLPFNKTIYPRELVLGYFRGEPVYSRENIHDLFSRKQWMEFHNREVFDNEQPIKIKRRKLTRSKRNEQALQTLYEGDELFGIWQTKPVKHKVPDGPIQREKIPIPSSSPYGSVNLIGKRCIPIGCVHLKGMPGIAYVVREMKTTPWKPALTGFKFKANKLKPVFDGVVVWEADQDAVLKQYKEYRGRHLTRLYIQHCEKIQKLWTQLLKALLGRYYIALNQRHFKSGFLSFQRAKQAIYHHHQEHVQAVEKDHLESPSELIEECEHI